MYPQATIGSGQSKRPILNVSNAGTQPRSSHTCPIDGWRSRLTGAVLGQWHRIVWHCYTAVLG